MGRCAFAIYWLHLVAQRETKAWSCILLQDESISTKSEEFQTETKLQLLTIKLILALLETFGVK